MHVFDDNLRELGRISEDFSPLLLLLLVLVSGFRSYVLGFSSLLSVEDTRCEMV